MSHALSLRGVTFAYGSSTVLRDVDLDLPHGEILGLIGPNGAGKTTMMRILSGQLTAQSGEVTVLGDRAPKLSAAVRASIGIVFESTQLPSTMKGRDLLRFCRDLHPDWDGDRAAALCDQLGVDPSRRVRQWSRGMRAKFMIVLAVAYRPQLLLLDEPFGGIDVVARDEVLDVVLQQVADTGCTVLLATHDLREVERVADRVAYLDEGDLAFCERVDELVERYRRVRVVLPSDDDAAPDWIDGAFGVQRDGRVLEYVTANPAVLPTPNGTSIQADRMTLEDIFVAHARARRGAAAR